MCHAFNYVATVKYESMYLHSQWNSLIGYVTSYTTGPVAAHLHIDIAIIHTHSLTHMYT